MRSSWVSYMLGSPNRKGAGKSVLFIVMVVSSSRLGLYRGNEMGSTMEGRIFAMPSFGGLSDLCMRVYKLWSCYGLRNMKKFTDTIEHCGQGKVPARCHDCRTDRRWRQLIRQDWEVPNDWDDVCPWGVTLEVLDQMPPGPVPKRKSRSLGLGDTVAKFIHWISFGRIKPCCGCRRRQKFLNKVFPYNRKRKET